MNVAQLIQDLQKLPPQKPVKIVLSQVYRLDESGEYEVSIGDDDAIEADDIADMVGFILIRSK